jgi:hypothetical protein
MGRDDPTNCLVASIGGPVETRQCLRDIVCEYGLIVIALRRSRDTSCEIHAATHCVSLKNATELRWSSRIAAFAGVHPQSRQCLSVECK